LRELALGETLVVDRIRHAWAGRSRYPCSGWVPSCIRSWAWRMCWRWAQSTPSDTSLADGEPTAGLNPPSSHSW